MNLSIRYESLSKAYYALCMCMTVVYMLLDMRTMEHGVEPYPGTGMMTCLIMMVCVGSILKFYFIPGYKAYKPDTTMMLYLAYLLWIFIPIVLNKIPGQTMDMIVVPARQVIPITSLLLTYNYIRNYGNSKLYGWFFCVVSLILAGQYFLIMRAIFPEISHMVTSYYTLYFLPIIMLTCGKRRSIFFIVFTLLVLITSIKRGGIVAMGGGLLVYAVVYMLTSKKVKMTAVIGGLSMIILLGGLLFVMGDTDENNLIERFADAENDGGSKRDVTWIKTYNMIENSEPVELLFGHGYDKVKYDSQMGWSAHNDFLETCYDYGLIGMILYAAAFIAFGMKVWSHFRRKTPLAKTLAMFYAIYFMFSMTSHVIIYSWANVVMITIGYITAIEQTDGSNE